MLHAPATLPEADAGPTTSYLQRRRQLLLTMDEAAELLAVSRGTMERLVADRRIGTVRIGRSVRFSEANLQSFVELNTSLPRPPAPLIAIGRRRRRG